MHTARLLTVCLRVGCILMGGGCTPNAPRPECTPCPIALWDGCTPLPCEQNDTHLWKHYLPATSFADGNNETSNVLRGDFLQCLFLSIDLQVLWQHLTMNHKQLLKFLLLHFNLSESDIWKYQYSYFSRIYYSQRNSQIFHM